MQLLNTLYVTTADSYLRLENNTLRVDLNGEVRARVPLHHLQSIVCFGHVGVSLPLMQRLPEDGIALVMLDTAGRFKARLEGPVSGNVLLRQAQHRQSVSDGFMMEVSRSFVAGKLKNCRSVLMRGSREAKCSDDERTLTRGADNLAASMRVLVEATSLDQLRGIEGEAARNYFDCLNVLVRPDARAVFRMCGRTRRPPLDRMNALLSFVYSMWMNDCRSAIESAGLDPQVGFLHVLRPGRAALALDLMEEFRALGDRLVLSLINRTQVTQDSFVQREGGAITLHDDARRTVVVAYQERKQEPLTHPLLEQPIALGLVPFVQARLLARAIRGDVPGYLPFTAK